MNILVTGANGQLGNEMRRLGKNSSDNLYLFSDVVAPEGIETHILDITKAGDVHAFVKQNQINAIINCAAYTNVDKAETDAEFCELLNSEAPSILAKAMKEVGGLLVHISTDYVFGGDPYNTPCKENQRGTPTGIYGLTKLKGEQNILNSGVDYIILRTSWLYSEFGKNFVKTMLNLTLSKPQLKVVFDQCGTPTYAGDLAEVIFEIVENKKYVSNSGIYHFSNEGVCSWFDFAKKIAQLAGHTSCDIQPCHSDEFPSPVKRPAYSVLDKTKIKSTFGIKIPYWEDSLKKCMTQIKHAAE